MNNGETNRRQLSPEELERGLLFQRLSWSGVLKPLEVLTGEMRADGMHDGEHSWQYKVAFQIRDEFHPQDVLFIEAGANVDGACKNILIAFSRDGKLTVTGARQELIDGSIYGENRKPNKEALSAIRRAIKNSSEFPFNI